MMKTFRAARTALTSLALASALSAGVAGAEKSFEARWEQMRTLLSNEDLYRLLWDLPKGGDIHNHHEFSIPMSFWIDRAVERPYFVRFRLSACGEPESFQWQTLRKDSVERLPACAQADFKPAGSASDLERREWLAALTVDPSESKDEFFERAVRRLGDMELDAVLYADALVVAQKQLQAENAIYLRQGIPVCLNTDDRGIMDSNLTDEYFAAVTLFDLTWAEVARIGRWSLEFSFAEPALKKELLARYDRNLAAFERKYSGADWQQRVAQVQPQHSGYTPQLMKLRAN